jgi:exodeoxyribonuclease V alpha subunit
MNAPPYLHRMVRELFPDIGEELRVLLDGAVENSGLLASDYMTLRDLVELSGYTSEGPLCALLLVLLSALDAGSLCVEISEERLALRLADLAGATVFGLWPRRIVAALADHGYPELIADGDRPDRPLVRRRIGGRTFLYFQKQHSHERDLAQLLGRRLEFSKLAPVPGDLAAILGEVLVDRPLSASGRPVVLNSEQRTALAMTLLRPFVLVSGGPGTGKTSIVLTVLRCLARVPGFQSQRVALAAPTGRAAQRLNDSIRQGVETLSAPIAETDAAILSIEAQTLHRLLGYSPDRGAFRHHCENPLAADFVIVDEVSMVGLELMSRLFQALRPDARVLLLGDKDQLPSVDAGAVLANLTATDEETNCSPALESSIIELFPDLAKEREPRGLETAPARSPSSPPSTIRLQDVLVVLEQNHRSRADIQHFARGVNEQRSTVAGELPALKARDTAFADLAKKGGCWRMDGTDNLASWRDVLIRWAEYQYVGNESFRDQLDRIRLPASIEPESAYQATLDDLFSVLNRARILTLLRDGAWGSTAINQFLEETLRRRLDPSRERLFAGAAVLVTRNDYNLQLYNGDVGLTLRGASGGYRVAFPRLGGYVSLAPDALPAHELAFTMTVHKAQGSEYGEVLLVLPPQGGRRLLTKEMIYTGITRARNLAIICSSVEVLETAISRRVDREANLLELASVDQNPNGALSRT